MVARQRDQPARQLQTVVMRVRAYPLHRGQFSRVPIRELRPCSLVTQGRDSSGGLWRTCWVCPHASSATHSWSASW